MSLPDSPNGAGAATAAPPIVPHTNGHHLVLASTSTYRRDLLSRLRVAFQVEAPGTDETPRDGEAPAAVARRLAVAKATDVAARRPGALVIGSDQTLELHGHVLGKPGTREQAVRQLQMASGEMAVFHTAVAVVDADRGPVGERLVPTRVRFRLLDDDAILRYVALEPAFDCAGAARSEALGIALVESIESLDPTALVGLPLIATCDLLRRAGIHIP